MQCNLRLGLRNDQAIKRAERSRPIAVPCTLGAGNRGAKALYIQPTSLWYDYYESVIKMLRNQGVNGAIFDTRT